MSERAFISRFSPNRTDPDVLEAITITRHGYLEKSVQQLRDSVLTDNKHHMLFVGPRGIGKTHLLTLIVHRLLKEPDLGAAMRLAWLNEDESSPSFLDFLLRIYRALSERYPKEFPAEELAALYDRHASRPEEARHSLEGMLLRCLGSRTAVVVVENLDGLFRDWDEAEQQLWRGFIQNHPQFATLAAAQSLTDEIADQGKPFFGFFEVRQLDRITCDQARELLKKIAEWNHDSELAAFLGTDKGRARLRAIHHLAGGNPRLYIVLSDFITAESLDDLVKPLERLVDEQLTPYFQERLRSLPAQQRKIVEFLSLRPLSEPTTVKEIAERLFMAPNSVSSQLMKLKESGYVINTPNRRESYYELGEPLLRLSIQIKETRSGEPLRLLVDFLRVWYEREELQKRLNACPETDRWGKKYFSAALELLEKEPDFVLRIYRTMVDRIDPEHCSQEDRHTLKAAAELHNDEESWMTYAFACSMAEEHAEALNALTTVIEMREAIHEPFGLVFSLRGRTYRVLDRRQEAMADYTKAIELYEKEDADVDSRCRAFLHRGNLLYKEERFNEAIVDYSQCFALNELSSERNGEIFGQTLALRGFTYERLNAREEAWRDYDSILKGGDVFGEYREKALPIIHQRFLALSTRLDRWREWIDLVEVVAREGDLEKRYDHFFMETSFQATELIFRHLERPAEWRERALEVIAFFNRHKKLDILGAGLVAHLMDLSKSLVNEAGLEKWVEGWEEMGKPFSELGTPLRLLRCGVAYLHAPTPEAGEKVLLRLPLELRELLREVLETLFKKSTPESEE